MDTVTYPDTDVQAELDHWIFRHIDISQHDEFAKVLGVVAIPTALAVRSDGAIVARQGGFAEPDDFVDWLKQQCSAAALDGVHTHER